MPSTTKVSISCPDEVLVKIDKEAGNRSAFFVAAACDKLGISTPVTTATKAVKRVKKELKATVVKGNQPEFADRDVGEGAPDPAPAETPAPSPATLNSCFRHGDHEGEECPGCEREKVDERKNAPTKNWLHCTHEDFYADDKIVKCNDCHRLLHVHKEDKKTSYGTWHCVCGAASNNQGKTWGVPLEECW